MDKINYLKIARYRNPWWFLRFLQFFRVVSSDDKANPCKSTIHERCPEERRKPCRRKSRPCSCDISAGHGGETLPGLVYACTHFGFLVRSANLKKSLKHTHSHSLKFLTLLTKNIQKGNFSLTPHFPAVPAPQEKPPAFRDYFWGSSVVNKIIPNTSERP